jgi:hypothetical protein
MSTLSPITIDTPFFPLELIYRIKQKRSSIDTVLRLIFFVRINDKKEERMLFVLVLF